MADITISIKFYRWLFLLICLSSWKKLADSKEVRIVCYYTNWSVYRPGEAKFSPQNINPYLCTHLVYAFGGFTKENTLKPFDKYQDIEKGGYAKFTGLKTYNKKLKTLIAIGGWNEGSSRFSPMVASPERRKELVKNTVKFLRQNHFDGLDLDWEYPTFRDGGKSRDRDNYANLVKELREEFERESEKTGRSRLLLTMAVPAGIEYIKKGYDVPKLMKYLDWMNILSYDYHSAFEPAVNHHAPLFALEEESEYNYDTELNIDYTIKHYLENGAIPDKLVLGIPTYGRSYTLFNPEANEMGAPADGPGDMGEATRENGYLAYYEICDNVKSQDWEVVQPNENAMGPYAFKDNQWVGYDDEAIVRKKSEYVAKNDLGGIMFWAIDNDDFRGNCHGRPYPLIEAGKEALLAAYGMTDENLIAPPSKPIKTKSKPRRTQKTTTTTEAPEETSIAEKSSGRRRRIKTKQKEEKIVSASSPKRRKTEKAETSSYSSLKVTTPSWTTPPPPATPDMGGAFKCEDEGFFPHPKDCKKYFWCLAGAGDSGIVAHQFTCPAGLYFNKAADSCDYTQNVLCNKKLQKITTSTSTTEESSSSSSTTTTTSRSSILSGLFSTTRAPPKITAATSRTTFVSRTTTEAAEEEYDDEEYDDDEETKSEEDPRVIKELIELIRKAGGIEQLEKSLKIGKGVDSTTQSGLSKSLYERVLSKTSQKAINSLKKTTGFTRNSAGPQNQGLESNEGKSSATERGRIQYQNIARKRPTTEKSIDEEIKNEYVSQDKFEKDKSTLNEGSRPKNSLEYVNIRRPKSGASTTEAQEEDDSEFSRNKILGETSDEQTGSEDENPKKVNNVPQYVNIRRQRPSTTEESVVEESGGSTTLRYVSIRRSTTPSSVEEEDEENPSEKTTRASTANSNSELFKTTRYQTISRSSTTASSLIQTSKDLDESKSSTASPSTEENSSSKYQVIRRSTTTASPLPSSEENDVSEQNVITKLDEKSITSSSIEEQSKPNISHDTTLNKQESPKIIKGASLFRPRPFSFGSSTTTTESAPEPSKVSDSNIKFRLGQSNTYTSTESTPTNVRSRVRGSSRFSSSKVNDNTEEHFVEEKQQAQPTRTRKRVIATTEPNVDYNLEQNRKYRPAELADLSSLTAVDINLRGVNFQSTNRRRRPVTTTATSVEPLNESEKTGPKTLSLARKHLQNNSFGNRRRVALKTEDQQNDSSELSSTVRPKRIFRTTTSAVESEILESKTSQKITNSTPRPRKVIRRFRPGSTASVSTTEPTLSNEISSTTSAQILKRKRIPIFRTRTTKIESSSTTQSTITTIDEDATTFSTASPLIKLFSARPESLPINDNNTTNEENFVEPHVDILNAEEGENIKLSESNIRESSQINSFISDEKPHKFRKTLEGLNKKQDTTTTDLELENIRTTEPSRSFRTRKIIRKLSTTEAPLQSTTETKQRKIVLSRLRPTNLNRFDATAKDDKLETDTLKKNLKNRFTPSDLETLEKEPVKKRIFRPNLNKRPTDSNEETKTLEEKKFTDQTTETSSTRFAPRLSLYTRTTSTTPKTDDTSEDFIEESEDIDEEDDTESDYQEEPKYRIYTTSSVNRTHHYESNLNFNDDTESNTNDGVKQNKYMSSTVSKMAVNAKNDSELIVDSNEDNTENNESTSKRNLFVYQDIDRPSFRQKYLISKESEENSQQDMLKSKPGTATEASRENDETTTDTSFEATTVLVDLNATEKADTISQIDSEFIENQTVVTSNENISLATESQSTQSTTSDLTPSTTEFIPKSTLHSIRDRPKFGQRRTSDTLLSTTRSSGIDSTLKPVRAYGRGRPTTLRPARPVTLVANKATSFRSTNKFIRKYSTTERNILKTTEISEEELENYKDEKESIDNFSSTEAINLSTRRKFGKVPASERLSTTKTPKVTSTLTTPKEDLGIDTEAVKNRNKNLFLKRKMNTPYIPTSTASNVIVEELNNNVNNSENVNVELELTTFGSQPMETTDYLTTLHHVFAEVEDGNTNMVDSSTETMESKSSTTNKIERLIEVNRIVEVSAKENNINNHEANTKVEVIPTLDKIGEITRVTVIKIVDGNNETVIESFDNNEIPQKTDNHLKNQEILHVAKIEEVPNPLSAQSINLINSNFDINLASSNREERKFEIFGGSKVSNDKTLAHVFPEIIDGRSHINVITSKPFINSETSTISLESLFKSENSNLNPSFSNVDEVLETDKSEFVNVRVLSDKQLDRFPIIQTLDDEEVTIQAQVLEVTQKPSARTFKIVPIKVETAKNVAAQSNK